MTWDLETRERYRSDGAACSEFFGTLYPDAQERRRAATLLADSIDRAHRLSHANWAVSLFPHQIRLNVGKVEVLTLDPQILFVVVDGPALSLAVKEKLWGLLEYPTSRYSVVLDEKGIARVPSRVLEEVVPLIHAAHLSFIDKASGTAKTTAMRRSHSPGVLLFLREFLERDVPQPFFPPKKSQ